MELPPAVALPHFAGSCPVWPPRVFIPFPLLCSGGRDHLIRVWDVETLVCRRTLGGHTDDILSLSGVSVSVPQPDLAQLISPGSPRSPTAQIIAGISPVGQPLASPSGTEGGAMPPGSPRSGLDRALLFVSAAADGTVRLWSGECAAGEAAWVISVGYGMARGWNC